jgi:hypothetical protein
MRIEGPSGNPLTVTKEGRMLGYVITETEAENAVERGEAYSILFEADPGGTDQDFFYLKNNEDESLHIHAVSLQTPTLDIDIDILVGVTGSPTAGTEITPANWHAPHGNTLDVTAEYKAGDLDMTGGTLLDTINLEAVPGDKYFPLGLILAKNGTMCFNCKTTDPTAVIRVVLYLFRHNIAE